MLSCDDPARDGRAVSPSERACLFALQLSDEQSLPMAAEVACEGAVYSV